MSRSIVAFLAVLLVGAGAAGAYWKFVEEPSRAAAGGPGGGRGGPGGPVPVEVTAVFVAPAESTVTAVGSLRSNESIVLKPEVAGRVTDINFEEGRPVRRGEVLVELDDDVEKAQEAEAAAALVLARANFERARELRRTNAGTQRALDEAQAEIRGAEALVALAQARFAKRWLKAPFDAQAGLREVSLGDYLDAGEAIVNLEQIDPLKVDFRVPELFLPSLSDGQEVSFLVDAFPGEAFTGSVFAINPLVDEAGRAVVIRARVDNPDRRLRPGLFARVTLTLAERAEALWIPEEALVPQGAKQLVYRLAPKPDGSPPGVEPVEVALGKRLPGRVEIASGLGRGDKVVSAGVMKLRPGATVAPTEVPPPALGGGGGGEPPTVAPVAGRANPAG